ncbi:MAG: hypothetical protein ACLFQX_04420 [Candidatus Kapaibacterium sp.]
MWISCALWSVHSMLPHEHNHLHITCESGQQDCHSGMGICEHYSLHHAVAGKHFEIKPIVKFELPQVSLFNISTVIIPDNPENSTEWIDPPERPPLFGYIIPQSLRAPPAGRA